MVLEVEPASAGLLSGLIEQFRKDQTSTTPDFQQMKDELPALHFMSMSVYRGADFDPVFIIEVNFDYDPGPFWAQFEAAVGDRLRPMLRCCKRPMDEDGPLYDAVTAEGSRYPVAPYLEHRTIEPSVFHHGNRGLSRDRIVREGMLFQAVETELDKASYRGITAQQIHTQLRAAMLGQFEWLGRPEEERITRRERLNDCVRLFGVLLILLFVLSLPGFSFLVFLRAFFPAYAFWFVDDLWALAWLLILPLIVGGILLSGRAARPGEAAPSRSGGLSPYVDGDLLSIGNLYTLILIGLAVVAAIAVVFGTVGAAGEAIYHLVAEPVAAGVAKAYFAAAGSGWFHALIAAAKACHSEFEQAITHLFPAFFSVWKSYFNIAFRVSLVGIYTAFFISVPLILLWLRFLERRDSHHDAPDVDPYEMRKMTRREDWIPQNHMGSVVLVKPGVLRMALFRTGHFALGLVLRVVATDGYLGTMRTVHFAHWAFINNGSRLMFVSNFDQTWDSYLDDFIEKAHGGLTLAWGSCTGFPATRFLVMDGASHGRQFKTWARHSMAVSRFWYSAYTEFTVNQVERQARIAEGLRKESLSSEKAAEWVKDL